MIKAVIFDMDGVISDTNFFLGQIEAELLKNYGVSMDTEDILGDFAGVKDEEFFKVAIPDISDEETKEIIEEKWRRAFKNLKGNIKPVAGIQDLVARLYEAKYNMAVASASNNDFINLVVKELGIEDKFSVLVSVEEVAKGKPSPDVFLKAAKDLGVAPEECLVIEDGHNGMEAARAAGMKCIGLISSVEDEYPVDKTVKHLDEVTVDLIKNL